MKVAEKKYYRDLKNDTHLKRQKEIKVVAEKKYSRDLKNGHKKNDG